MKRSILISFFALLAIIARASQPNVLMIIFDDLRPETGAYGAPDPITPNLDKFAAEGVRFNNAYVNYPLCLPSRAAMLTGIRFDNNRHPDGSTFAFPEMIATQQTWPAVLHQAGYWTATSGKLYHGDVPMVDEAAWDIPGPMWKQERPYHDWNQEILARIVDMGGREDQLKGYLEKGDGSGALVYVSVDCDDDLLNDGQTAATVEDYLLNKRDKSKPFAICAGFHRPHMPWVAPSKYFDMYPEDIGTLAYIPEGQAKELRKQDLKSTSLIWNEGVSDSLAKRLIRGYMAATTFADAQMGRIISALKQTGEYENTIIIVWGDHGYHLTDHGMWRKNTEYHVSLRCPLMFRVPGIRGNQTRDQVVKNIDIYPTLLELCEVKQPADVSLHGNSLAGILRKADAPWVNENYTCARNRYGIITERYRFTSWDEYTELYDLQKDPHEWVNLAGDKNHRKTVDQFNRKLEQVTWNRK